MISRILALLALLATATGASAQRKHNYDLLDVNWSIAFDEKDSSIAGDVTNTLALTEANAEQVALHAGKLSIKAVTVDGKQTTFTQEGELLLIKLPGEHRRATPIRVRVLYTGKPQAGVYFSAPEQSTRKINTMTIYTQGEAEDTRYWLPTYDEPDDKATSEGRISVPKGYFALSNGKLVDIERRATTDVFHWKMPEAHSTYLISFVAGRYSEGREMWNGLPVNYYVPAGTEEMGAPAFGGTADMVRFYSELTGVKYPYPKFAQSAVGDFPFGGMENITAVTQTIDALFPPSEIGVADARGLVLHELAHQWFGDLITCRSWAHNWLNEGFATFLPHFYFRYKDGEDAYQLQKAEDIDAAIGSMKGKPRPMVQPVYDVPMDIFDGHAYPGGSARMFMLQALLGEKVFWKGVHQFLTEFAYNPVTTEDFFEVMSRSSGRDLSEFNKQWFHTAALPTITVSRDGNHVKLTQGEPTFSMDVDVWSWHEGHWNKEVASLNGKEATVSLASVGDPVLVDPLVNWVAEVTYAKAPTAEEVQVLYAHAPNAAQKGRLARLAQAQGYSSLLLSMSRTETSKALREFLAELLPTSDPAYLLELSKDANPHLRQAAIASLKQCKPEASVVNRLREMYENEPSVGLRRAALDALLALTKDDALAEKAWNQDAYNDTFRVAALRWWTGSNPDKARELAVKALSDGHTESVRYQALGTLGHVKDKPGEKRALNALIAVLSGRGHREKENAIAALQDYGDPAAIPALESFRDYSMYQIRNAAIDAIKNLSAKKS
jgi:aminopeptidase N